MCLYAVLDTTRAPDMYAAMQQNVLGHIGDRAKCPPNKAVFNRSLFNTASVLKVKAKLGFKFHSGVTSAIFQALKPQVASGHPVGRCTSS